MDKFVIIGIAAAIGLCVGFYLLGKDEFRTRYDNFFTKDDEITDKVTKAITYKPRHRTFKNKCRAFFYACMIYFLQALGVAIMFGGLAVCVRDCVGGDDKQNNY